MPTDREYLKYQQAGALQTSGAIDPTGEVAKAHSFLVEVVKAADDATAATTTAETYTGKMLPVKGRLKSVRYYATTGGITADATNNATVTVSKRDSAAGNKLTVATMITNVALGNITQGVLKSATLTDANVIVDANSSFTFEIAKAGTGVVVRAGSLWLEFEAV